MHQTPFERIERMFEEASKEFAQPWRSLGDGIGTAAVDVAETDGEFVVTCDLPGFDRDDIDVRVTDHTLHIHAEHEAEEEIEAEDYIHRERRRPTSPDRSRSPRTWTGTRSRRRTRTAC